jgi:methionyl-tRNA formyltransferase
MSSFVPRFVYVGLPLGALVLEHAGFRPVAVALGHADAPGARRVKRWQSLGIPVLDAPDLTRKSMQQRLSAAAPDTLLSWFWPKRLPATWLSQFPRGAYGVHPSLLPAYRGPDPYFWSILAGERETGVTLHHLDAEYDTGAIVDQRRMDIRPDDSAWSLAKRLDRPSLALLRRCAERLAAGERLEGTAQHEAMASNAPRPTDEDLVIHWQRPVAAILRLIRAAAPHPGATTEIAGEVCEVVRARAYGEPLPAAIEPADAVLVPQVGVVVRARDGGVVLERLRLASGEERVGHEIASVFSGALSAI